jgi:guanylate kinase
MELKRRGLMLILSSPSGAGKTTLSRKLLEREKDNALTMSISVTTRKPRPGEQDGKDYFFVSHEKFLNMAAADEFLEHAQVFENHYGTPAAFVRNHVENGTDVLFDIDWQGTRQLAAKARADVVSIFILPPSIAELERRLKARAQDSDEVVKKRMEKALNEISHWGEYDYVLINQDLDETLEKIDIILKAERMKHTRQQGLEAFIKTL